MDKLKTNTIFISYRRDDCRDEARQFKTLLDEKLGTNATFLDEKAIQLTNKWKGEISKALESAETLLVLIGPNWVESFTKKSLQDQTDWVRFELETAARERLDIIPVYLNMDQPLDETDLPDDFPADIKKMIPLQGIYVPKGQFDEKATDLANCLKVLYGLKESNEVTTSLQIPLLGALPLPQEYIKKARKLKCPFLGPRYFKEEEAALYFGRERDIRNLFHLSRQNRIILLYGYSGIGKSSLLHAGFVPRVKDLTYWKIFDPIRRNKQEGGLNHQLRQRLETIATKDVNTKRLIILDQVEEMITDPLNPPEIEATSLVGILKDSLARDAALRFILVFRSDYLASIEDVLTDNDAEDFKKLHLRPLNKEGMERAIVGVAENGQLNTRWHQVEFDQGLPQIIVKDLQGEDPYAVRTPLLQIQLLKLFEKAAEKRKDPNVDPIRITEDLYKNNRQHNLDQFLKEQLDLVAKAEWQDFLENGLFLEILTHYVTDENTAGSRKDDEIAGNFSQLEPIGSIIQALKQNYLLVDQPGDVPGARLAHDALVPAIKRAIAHSNAPAQAARRILDSKQGEIKSGTASFKDKDDIQKLEQGRPFMSVWTEEEQIAYEKGRQFLQTQLENEMAIREKEKKARKRAFELLKSEIDKDFLRLSYDSAFQKTKELAELNYELEEVARFFRELAFFWSASGKKEMATMALTAAKDLGVLDQLSEQVKWLLAAPLLSHFQEVLAEMDGKWYAAVKKRYYPIMTLVEGGTFEMMGGEEEKHLVKVDSFRIAVIPVTFWQYGLFCAATGRQLHQHSPSWGIFGDNPVVNVNWYDAIEYCNWLSEVHGLEKVYTIHKDRKDPNNQSKYDDIKWLITANHKANGYRLPTNAEWEFAARGGHESKGFVYSGSNDLDEVGWYRENSSINGVSRTHPVEGKKDNELGLHDMSGNVWEWCWDWYGDYPTESPENSTGPKKGEYRVLRGGSWFNNDYSCRVDNRNSNDPNYRSNDDGFRLTQGLPSGL